MLYFNRIDVSEGIGVNKTSAKGCVICLYWYFLNCSFKLQPNVCNRCHDLLMISMNHSDIAILNIKGSGFRCIINVITKNEAINLMQNADLTEKNQNIIKHKNLLSHTKMGKKILMFRELEMEKKITAMGL